MDYYYSLMFMASLHGGAVFKPSFFEFPADISLQTTHAQNTIMIGPALIAHPVLYQGATTVNAYFPADLWYNWFTGLQVVTQNDNTVVIHAPLSGNITLHVRGGFIVPTNDAASNAMTATGLRNGNITLVIALNANGRATGILVLDDGVSLGTIENGTYTLVNYEFVTDSSSSAVLNIKAKPADYIRKSGEWPFISQIKIFGCQSQIISVKANGKRVHKEIYYNWDTKIAIVGITGIAPDRNNVLTFGLISLD
jgi:alpha-glucosidase (family GH31 glycosyl hydrolase)